ncbi:uncharacterized protein [Gossypium hirsutum]|uniref:Uncharacterized protein isoform X2 n=1 Tax=Gossypium hirsutum TaxID=3635 RepID=A0ABM3ASH4_GOSHI|nr:uncharacterized protein LOC107892096 isoform X2 [Gossypium hirsutum]
MTIANSFDLWKKDAFFFAAEVVQKSADMHGKPIVADHVFQQGDPILETKKKTKDQRYEDPHHGEGKSTNEAHRERYEQHLKAESANMLKTVEDLEVSRSNKLQLQAFWRM